MNLRIGIRWIGISWLIVALSLLARPAWAHGEPVITLSTDAASPGQSIVITGSEMEAGEVFVITLEGVGYSAELGRAEVTEEGDEGGFEISVTLPLETPPGTYVIRAATEAGESATADLTVAELPAGADPAVPREASAEPMDVERPRPAGQVTAVVLGILLAAGVGLWLVRRGD